MKNKLKNSWILLLLLALSISCSKDDDDIDDPVTGKVELNSEINDFIWKGMNYWYYYQSQVDDLADTKDDNQDNYYTYLNEYSNPQELFNDLVYTQEDDFSWYIEDVEAQANAFRGISESYGINLGFAVYADQSQTDVFVYVGYVSKNSPASEAGIERGDLIYSVNGTTLNADNFSIINKLYTESSISLGFAEIVDNAIIYDENDISLTPVVINENPVYYHDIIETGGTKIGYLVYNSFVHTYHQELNDVFAEFKSQNINELVLDLRYNGGGSVVTSAFLASMIDGNVTNNKTFANLVYNQKRDADEGAIYPFFDQGWLYDKSTGDYTADFDINRLTTLNRVYVIVTEYTASASEMIINGLRPYMDVFVVGGTTVGKNEGSITVYDSKEDFTSSENRNPNHNVGMQPIVFQITNSNNESDYDDGFTPDLEIDESMFAASIKPFGDPEEQLLKKAIDNITGVSAKQSLFSTTSLQKLGKVKGPKFSTEMYMLPSDLDRLK
jgi:C-terminal processing protease CtpA/Prc